MTSTRPRTPAADPHITVLLLHGPNMNLLDERDPHQYGTATLSDVEDRVRKLGAELGITVRCEQRNSEGALIDLVQEARHGNGIILNPGAYGHYGIALRDAIESVRIPCVEVHLSNVHQREEFRHRAVTGAVSSGYLCGMGALGYDLALRALHHQISAAP